ncbi:unnamed protein product [Agarophyton chilense]
MHLLPHEGTALNDSSPTSPLSPWASERIHIVLPSFPTSLVQDVSLCGRATPLARSYRAQHIDVIQLATWFLTNATTPCENKATDDSYTCNAVEQHLNPLQNETPFSGAIRIYEDSTPCISTCETSYPGADSLRNPHQP